MARNTLRMAPVCWLLLSSLLFFDGGPVKGDALGGIQPGGETPISLEKERVTINAERISVEYELLNPTGQEITTEILLPLPGEDASSRAALALAHWNFWVEGNAVKYETEARAADENGVDQTSLLRAGGRDLPTWIVFKTFHWQQRFPAHSILHVKLEYSSTPGMVPLNASELQEEGDLMFDSCVDPALRKLLIAAAPNNRGTRPGRIDILWVDHILTSANAWKMPIKDFELVVEKTSPEDYVSFCWDGKVERADNRTFIAKAKNFVPRYELKVLFFQVRR